MEWLSDEAFAGVEVADLFSRNIGCILSKKMAFLSCVTARGASDVRVLRMSAYMWCRHVGVAYQSSVGGTGVVLPWQKRRNWTSLKLWFLGQLR